MYVTVHEQIGHDALELLLQSRSHTFVIKFLRISLSITCLGHPYMSTLICLVTLVVFGGLQESLLTRTSDAGLERAVFHWSGQWATKPLMCSWKCSVKYGGWVLETATWSAKALMVYIMLRKWLLFFQPTSPTDANIILCLHSHIIVKGIPTGPTLPPFMPFSSTVNLRTVPSGIRVERLTLFCSSSYTHVVWY